MFLAGLPTFEVKKKQPLPSNKKNILRIKNKIQKNAKMFEKVEIVFMIL